MSFAPVPTPPAAALPPRCAHAFQDEVGYIAGANTCIFGGGGAAPPRPLHPLTKLRAIKISNSSSAYTGENRTAPRALTCPPAALIPPSLSP